MDAEGVWSKVDCRIRLAGAAIIVGHVALLVYGAIAHSPNNNEVGHLAAGLSHWQDGRYDLYRVNPPLVRMVAAFPLFVSGFRFEINDYSSNELGRPEFPAGSKLLRAEAGRIAELFAIARCACIPFSVLCGVVTWLWATRLYGSVSGLIALVLWCICPNVLGHGQLITPDIGATALGLAAGYAFWRWLKYPTWKGSAISGVVLGLAELTKTTWIILFLLWPALMMFWRYSQPAASRTGLRGQLGKMAVMLLLAVYTVNLVYGFEGSFSKLRDYRFVSHTLRGDVPSIDKHFGIGNRFIGTSLANLPIPFPRNYLEGIDRQKRDFEGPDWSYLRGEWRSVGWYYYYVYAMLIKIPVGTLLMVGLATAITLVPRKWSDSTSTRSTTDRTSYQVRGSTTWRDELVLLIPAAIILFLVSSQTGFNRHLRYVLPVFPFLFIWASRVGQSADFSWLLKLPTKVSHAFLNLIPNRRRQVAAPSTAHDRLRATAEMGPARALPGDVNVGSDAARSASTRRKLVSRTLALLIVGALAWSTFSSLRIYPHSLSYFNELVGGPARGHLHLDNSNVDWGQDLWFVKAWYDEHLEARPLHLAYDVPDVDPRVFGIDYERVPPGPVMNREGTLKTPNWPWHPRPRPSGSRLNENDRRQDKVALGPFPGWYIVSLNAGHRRQGDYEYFQEFDPVDRIGYSMNVYHITHDGANRVRQKLSLPPLQCADGVQSFCVTPTRNSSGPKSPAQPKANAEPSGPAN